MTNEEAKSCIGTIEMLQRLAYNIHGVMDVIDADNCKKIIKALERDPTTKDCISRQSVLDKIQRLIDAEQNNIDENGDYMNYARERVNAYEAIQFFVENDCLCPSVKPQFSSGLDKNSKELEKNFGESDCIIRDSAIKALDYDIKCFEFKSGVSKHMDDIAKLLNTIYETQVNNIKTLPSVPQKPILDKIRAEIKEEKEHAYADFERYKVEYLGQDQEDALDSLPQDDFRYGMERAIEIIDKCKAESEKTDE